MSQLLNPQQAADQLGISVQTLANWRCNGEGPGLPWVEISPRCIRYRAEDIEAFVERRCRGG